MIIISQPCHWASAYIWKAPFGSADLSVQRQSGRKQTKQTQAPGKGRLCLFSRSTSFDNLYLSPIRLSHSLIFYFLTQFYTNLARVLGLEALDEVSWPQFVAYLLKTNPKQDVSGLCQNIFWSSLFLAQDPHWKSYTDQCSPCLLNFTYVVHLEKATPQIYFCFHYPQHDSWPPHIPSLKQNVQRIIFSTL